MKIKTKEQATMDEKKTMLSGIKPSGDLTLGSYLGPLHHWPKMIEEYD